MRNYNLHNEDEKGIPANVPMRHYDPEDRIALAQPVKRPASTRAAVPGINCPEPGETWSDIHAFRAKWGLPPVAGE